MVKQSTKKGSVPLVEVSNLNFAYGQKKILSDISFAVEPNCFVAVLGLSLIHI